MKSIQKKIDEIHNPNFEIIDTLDLIKSITDNFEQNVRDRGCKQYSFFNYLDEIKNLINKLESLPIIV